MEFQCSKCGACCHRAGKLGLMPQREDGACVNLSEDNTCKIYKTRPEICRVDVMANKNEKLLNIGKKDYFKISNCICNQWIKEDGIDKSFLIDIEVYDRADST